MKFRGFHLWKVVWEISAHFADYGGISVRIQVTGEVIHATLNSLQGSSGPKPPSTLFGSSLEPHARGQVIP